MVWYLIAERGTPMDTTGTSLVESESLQDFALVMQHEERMQPRAHSGTPCRARLELGPEQVKNGLGQLVLTVVKLLHELLERQALRRIDARLAYRRTDREAGPYADAPGGRDRPATQRVRT